MPVVFEFVESDLELLTKQVTCMVCTVSENVVYAEELRLVVYDYAGIR